MATGKALARREEEEEVLRSCLRRVVTKAAETLEGLYNGKNPDADKTWAECSMKTRAALIITKTVEGKNDQEMGKALGVIILTGRATSVKEWEAQARKVDLDERKRAAIDVTPMPPEVK